MQQHRLEEIPNPSQQRLLPALPGEAWFEELGSASFPWKTLPGDAPALDQVPKTLAGWKSPQLGHGAEPLRAGDGTCSLSLLKIPRAWPTSPALQWAQLTLSLQGWFPS